MLIMCIVHIELKECQVILLYDCDKQTNSKKRMNQADI